MKIAICDDDRNFAERLIKIVSKFEGNEVFVFNSGGDFLQNKNQFDIVLLDIEIPDKNGFEIAGELISKNKNCIFLFITSHGQYSTKGYEFRAFRYVLKSEPDSFIERNIKDAIDEYKNNHFILELSSKHEIARIPARDILYIEAYGHASIIHTDERDYRYQERFREIYKKLSLYGFLQCHKSYIVNIRHIKSIEKNSSIKLKGNISIPIGRKYSIEVIDQYLKYDDRRN